GEPDPLSGVGGLVIVAAVQARQALLQRLNGAGEREPRLRCAPHERRNGHKAPSLGLASDLPQLVPRRAHAQTLPAFRHVATTRLYNSPPGFTLAPTSRLPVSRQYASCSR